MRLYLTAAFFSIAPAGFAAAQELPVISSGMNRLEPNGLTIATCRTGEGCHCYASSESLESLQTYAHVEPPEGVTDPILVQIDGELHWSTQSSHAIDLVYGGDGLCDPEPFGRSDNGLPENGLWTMTITDHELSGCPPQVASAITGEAVVGRSEQRTISWPRPFSMAPLTADNPTVGRWHNRGGGVWSTELFNEQGPVGGNARVAMTARIISPREIAVSNVFSTDALAVLTGETCRSTTHATLRLAR